MKSYNELYTQLLSEYQDTNTNAQNPNFLKLQNYFKQLGQNVDSKTIEGILSTLEDKPENITQTTDTTEKEEEEQNQPEVPKGTSPISNVTPTPVNNPLNPFNKNQQKAV
jgi:hypothetical protein